jgi:uncharacterized RDD family membrane protein YckC
VSAGLPPAARAIQGVRAGLISRLLAAGIDLAVVSLAATGAIVASSVWRYFFSGGATPTLRWPSQAGLVSLGGALLVLYLTWGWGRTGRTIGKRVLGLALVTASGGRVSWSVAAVRAILYAAFPLGLLWSGVSRSNRSVQDVLLGTAVVYDWRGARRTGPWHEAEPAASPGRR